MREISSEQPSNERESVSIFDTEVKSAPSKELSSEAFGNFEVPIRRLADLWLDNPDFVRDVTALKYVPKAMELLRKGVMMHLETLKLEYEFESIKDVINNPALYDDLANYTKKLTKVLRAEFAKEILN